MLKPYFIVGVLATASCGSSAKSTTTRETTVETGGEQAGSPNGPTAIVPQQVSGDTAKSGKITASFFCQGQLPNTSLFVSYSVDLTDNGDLYAQGEVHDSSYQTSGSAFYSASQNGADTAAVQIVRDEYAPADAGFWRLSLDRTTLTHTVTYTDADVQGGMLSWTMQPPQCSQNNY